MAVAHRASSSAGPFVGTIAVPTGTQAGDALVLVAVAVEAEDLVFTVPAGFTSRLRVDFDAGSPATFSFETFTGIAGDGTGGTVNITGGSISVTNSGGNYQIMMCASYSGVDTSDEYDAGSTATFPTTGSSYTATWTGVTAARADSMLVCIWAGYGADSGTPAGMTVRIDNYDAANDLFDQQLASAGATGNRTATIPTGGGLNGGIAALLVVQPPGGGGGGGPRRGKFFLAARSMADAA